MSSYVYPQFKYLILHIFTCILHHLRVYYELTTWPAPRGLIAQLVEPCTGIALKFSALALISHLLKLCELRWSIMSSYLSPQFKYTTFHIFRPGSNAVLHMSRTQFNQLGSCEVRRLTQLSSTGFIWSGWGVLHAWPAVKNVWRPTLGQTSIFTWAEPNAHQRSNGAILTLPWKPLTNKTAFVFCLV